MSRRRQASMCLALLVVVVGAGGCDGGDSPKDPLDDRATVSATPSSTLEPTTAAPIELTIGAPMDLPAGLAIYWSPKRQNADGAGHRLYRIHRDDAGELTRRDLYPFLADLPQDAYVADFVPSWSEGELTVTVCVEGYCTRGPGQPTEDARLVLMSSSDMGLTWSGATELPQHSSLGGSLDGEIVVATVSLDMRGNETSPHRFWLHPSAAALTPPDHLGRPWPLVQEGKLVWSDLGAGGVFYDSSGAVAGRAKTDNVVLVLAVDGGSDFSFISDPPRPGRDAFVTIERTADGKEWSISNEGSYVTPMWSIDDHRLLGNATLVEPATGQHREYAVLVDLESGTIHPLPEMSEGLDALVTPRIWGVRREP